MADLPIASAAALTGATLATNDLLPILDVSASAGSQGSKITVAELFTGRTAVDFTANKLTLTALAANTAVLAATGYSLTGSNATAMVDLAGTWNTTGVATAIKLNITNNASGAGSLLMDLQAGGISRFSVSPAGISTHQSGIQVAAGNINLQSTWGIEGASGNQTMYSAGSFGWASGNGGAGVAVDALFRRKAAGSIQMGTDAASSQVSQIFSACGARIGTDSNTTPTNTLTLAGPHCTGTGTGGDLRLGVYGTNGASGTAIGTLNTVLTVVAARKVLNISSIPTSATGLSSGDVYSNAGILTIVP